MLGGNTPLGVLLSGFFMGIIKAGSLQVERATAVSRSLSMIIQGIMITFVACKAIKLDFKGIYKRGLSFIKRRNSQEGEGAKAP